MKKIIIPVLSLFLIFSCDMLPSPDKEKDEPTKFENILNSYSTALGNVLTEEQKESLLTNSLAAAGDVTSEDPVVLVPLAVETIIGSLSEISLTSQEKIDVVNEISSKSVDIIKSEINTTSRSSRNIDLTKLKNILNRVAKSIVKSVPASGILEEDYSKASESSLTNLVSSLGDSDIPEENITELSQTVTEGAVSQLSESKDDYINVEDEIVKSISQGAVKGIVNIESTTIKKEELIQDVTKAALDAVKELETDSAKVTILIIVVTDGTTEGINEVKDKLGDEAVVEAIKGISKETIESVKTLELSDEEMKEKVSELSSQINDKVTTNLPEIDNTEALKAVVSGIASGAQEISNEFQNIETLKETISIKDSENNEIDLTDLEEVINEGISQGQEEKKEEANTEDKEILEALEAYNSSIEELKKSLESSIDVSSEDIVKLENIIESLTSVTEKYPDNEYLAEIYLRIADSKRTLYKIKKDQNIIDEAITSAIKAKDDFDKQSWISNEASLLLRSIYTYDTKEFDKSIEVATSIQTNFPDKPDYIINSKYEIMDTYWQQLYNDFQWKNKFGDSTDFLNNTYIPAIEDVLNSGLDYTSKQYWMLTVAAERMAETYIWLHDIDGAIKYCFDLIDEVEAKNIPIEIANLTMSHLYYIAGITLKGEADEWPENNKLLLINGSIDALEEGLSLLVVDGEIIDKQLYSNTISTLIAAITLKAAWPYEMGALRNTILFTLERRLNELLPLARDLGNDEAGQMALARSYADEGRFYRRLAEAFENRDEDRMTLYYQKAESALLKGFETTNSIYLIDINWIEDTLACELVWVYVDLYDIEKAVATFKEVTEDRMIADWAAGEALAQILWELMRELDNKSDFTKEELTNYYNMVSELEPIARAAFDREPREYYSQQIRNSFAPFYFLYFMEMRELLEKPASYTDETLITARFNAMYYGKPEWGWVTGYGEPDYWYPLLFDDEANKYGDTVILDGGVNVIIK